MLQVVRVGKGMSGGMTCESGSNLLNTWEFGRTRAALKASLLTCFDHCDLRYVVPEYLTVDVLVVACIVGSTIIDLE